MAIFLYKKTHNKTGLQYLGKTKNNPQIYTGSGIKWLRHLKKWGKFKNGGRRRRRYVFFCEIYKF